MDWKILDDQNVAKIGYDDSSLELHIVFRSGSAYAFGGVQGSYWKDIQNAASPTRYMRLNLLHRFEWERYVVAT